MTGQGSDATIARPDHSVTHRREAGEHERLRSAVTSRGLKDVGEFGGIDLPDRGQRKNEQEEHAERHGAEGPHGGVLTEN
jgi:hypothetical protein